MEQIIFRALALNSVSNWYDYFINSIHFIPDYQSDEWLNKG